MRLNYTTLLTVGYLCDELMLLCVLSFKLSFEMFAQRNWRAAEDGELFSWNKHDKDFFTFDSSIKK